MTLRLERQPIPPDNPLIEKYLDDFERVSAMYRYNPYSAESMAERLGSLAAFRGDRRGVAAALADYNRSVGAGPETLDNIRLLERPDAAVVIGGQQAGILTGPLYTVYKAITLIRLSRRLSSELGSPIVPVFWVASEDHDFAEIDHIDFLGREDRIERLRLSPPPS